MELQDVMSLVGQPEYWPLMIGGLLFVLVLVLYRRVGKSAGATSRDLAALHDAVEQLTDRFDRLAAGGFPAVPDARPESPCDDDTVPLSVTGAVAGLAAGAVMTESEEALGEPLTEPGPDEFLADEEPAALAEEEPVDGFSFDAAAEEDDEAALAAASVEPGPDELLADEEPAALAEEEPVGGFSFDAAAEEDDEAALAAASVEPGPDEFLADEEPAALGEEEPVGGFSFDAAAEEDDAAALEAASVEPGPDEFLAGEEPAALAEEEPFDDFSFDATDEEDRAASEPLGESQGPDDFAFDAATDEKDEAMTTVAPAESAVSEVSSDDAGKAQPETESREDRAGMTGATSDEMPDRQGPEEGMPDAGEQQETAPVAVADSQPAAAMDEKVAPAEQQQSPELVALPGNPQRPEVALARCGQCGRKIAYPKRLSGKRVRCPSCKSGYVLP